MASRSTLVGKQVYNPNGTLVGTVQDVVLPVGAGEISLQLISRYRKAEVVTWSNIGAAADILILKKPLELKAPPIEDKPILPPAAPQSLAHPAQVVEGLVSRIRGAAKKTETKSCANCGNSLPLGASFCNKCGSKQV